MGIVLGTGFDTSKGKLIRKVVANTESLRLEEKDGLWIILFLLICSLITSAYVLDQGMDNEDRSKEKLFLRFILIITTVVPPELPMILTLTVNNSILELQKKANTKFTLISLIHLPIQLMQLQFAQFMICLQIMNPIFAGIFVMILVVQ